MLFSQPPAAEKAALSESLGAAVAEAAAAAPADTPFTVALSGGSLPKLLAEGLLAQEGVDYSNWHIFFADERVVPLDDDGRSTSNPHHNSIRKDSLSDH